MPRLSQKPGLTLPLCPQTSVRRVGRVVWRNCHHLLQMKVGCPLALGRWQKRQLWSRTLVWVLPGLHHAARDSPLELVCSQGDLWLGLPGAGGGPPRDPSQRWGTYSLGPGFSKEGLRACLPTRAPSGPAPTLPPGPGRLSKPLGWPFYLPPGPGAGTRCMLSGGPPYPPPLAGGAAGFPAPCPSPPGSSGKCTWPAVLGLEGLSRGSWRGRSRPSQTIWVCPVCAETSAGFLLSKRQLGGLGLYLQGFHPLPARSFSSHLSSGPGSSLMQFSLCFLLGRPVAPFAWKRPGLGRQGPPLARVPSDRDRVPWGRQ